MANVGGIVRGARSVSKGLKALENTTSAAPTVRESKGLSALSRATASPQAPVKHGDMIQRDQQALLQQRIEEGSLWGDKTGMPFTDDQLRKTQEGMNPRNRTEVVMMDVDQLIDEHARILSEATGDSKEAIIQSRLDDTEVMDELRNVFVEKGGMNIPALWKPGAVGETEGQEGLHRTLVARELGVKRVPVAVVHKAQREELEPLPLPEVVEE